MQRSIVTYPRHAARRAEEIRDLEQMGRAFQLRLGMTHEAGDLIQLMAGIPWDKVELGSSADTRKIIQAVAKACLLESRVGAFSEV